MLPKILYWHHFVIVEKLSMPISYLDQSSLAHYQNTLSSLKIYRYLKNIDSVNNIRRDVVNNPLGARSGAIVRVKIVVSGKSY